MLTGLVAPAAQVFQHQARQAAERFLKLKAGKSAASAVTVGQALPCAKTADGRAMAYAVNRADGDGFVLVVGSDQGSDVVGYSDHGTFTVEQMPANMRSWLDSYLENLQRIEGSGNAPAMRYATKTPIAPLLNSQWNQDQPYSDQCPIVNGKRAATGCSITAMAQIMYYYRWPADSTKAIPGYTPDNSKGTNYPTLPALEPTIFNWDKMYPSYKNNEDGTEVAKLMKYLGTASKAEYGEETGATGYDAVQALIKYFGYDAGARSIWRSQQSYLEWVNMLYAELQAKRPVMFSGTAGGNAHSFVVDGYDEEDFFHVNWGWGGDSDGYYRVLLMDPQEQGIGGSENGDAYSIDQVAFFGVQPDAGNAAYPARLTITKNWLFDDPDDSGKYEKITNKITSPYYENQGYIVYPAMNAFNYNGIAGEFTVGCWLVKDDHTVSREYTWETKKFNIHAGFDELSNIIYIDPESDPALTSGDYHLYFTSKLKNADTWQSDEDTENHYIKIHLDNTKGELSATSVSNEPILSAKNIKFSTATPLTKTPCDLTFTVQNTGTAAYHGDLGITKVNDDDSRDWLDGLSCDIEPGDSLDIKLSFTPQEAGKLNYAIQDQQDHDLYKGTMTVTESNITDSVDLTITHKLTNVVGTEIIGPKAQIDVTVTNNSDMTYNGEISIYCFKWVGTKYKFVYASQKETIPAHQTVVLKRESPELTDAECYSFTTMPHYVTYDAAGNATIYLQTATVKPDATVCALDLTNAPATTNIDTSSANPNLLIFTTKDSPLTGDNVVKDSQAERVVLTDGHPHFSPYPFNARHITYTRTPEVYFDVNRNKGWSTLVLPFAATGCQTTIDGEVTPLKWYDVNNNGEIMVATFRYENGSEMEFTLPEAVLTACHPYLLGIPEQLSTGKSIKNLPITFYADNADVVFAKASVTGLYYKMMGTMQPVSNPNIYVLDNSGSAFVKAANPVRPFHAYFSDIYPDMTTARLTIKFGIEHSSGIHDLDDQQPTDGQHDIYYNINGQRVTKPGKGIYIVNGKKVVF